MKMIKSMRRAGLIAALCAAVLAASGCHSVGKEAKALRLSGIEKLNSGDYSGAVTDLDAALQAADGTIGPFEIDVLKYRAEAEYELEDYTAASHTYDMLLEIDGENLEYLYLDALSKARSGDADSALALYEQAAEREKKKKETAVYPELKPETLTAVAEALNRAGRSEEVNAIYEKLIADGEADPAVLNSYGLSLMEEEKYEEALNLFAQAIRAAGTGTVEISTEGSGTAGSGASAAADAAFNTAVIYERQSEYKKALEAFQSYVSTYGSTPEAEKEIMFLKTR